ncbi:hypothetical protein [Thiomicrorhabdus sp.]|uniref:hypothetical protein n=1 Tax=Thiomicrorhabdus sp. TaxID=2039724 RepID=UPI00356327D1
MKFRFNRVSKSALSALVLSVGLSASATVLAEQPSGPAPQGQMMPHGQMQPPKLTPEQQATMMELRKLQMDMQGTQQELQGIQQKAFEQNPSLVKQRDKLQATMLKKMSNKDYDAKAELNALEETIKKYQDGKTKPTQEEMVNFRKRQMTFQQNQQKAYQDPEIQKMAESLKTDVEAKMVKADPKTKELLKKMENQSKKFMELRQKMIGG